MEPVRIELSEDDISGKTDSEKLELLLKIAFSNHKALMDHGKILFGNGKEGICKIVDRSSLYIKGLWATVIGGGSLIIGILIKHVIG